MLKINVRTGLLLAAALLILSATARAQYLMENLGRGVVAVRQNATDVYVGWRLFGTDPSGVAFNLYRSTGGGPAIQLNAAPITDSTNFVDAGADLTQSNSYFVRPVVAGVERAQSDAFTLAAGAPVRQYLNVPLQIPAGGTTPDGVAYTYSANDSSVGDLDGDGEYEIILKWDPSNSKDNSLSGYTGNVYLDAYKLDGTRLWRIDLGRNIRAGAHYTQFMVYDLDGDGKSEIACKTADATVDGAGAVIGNASADYRNSSGYILTGPEYLTVFNGLTGAAMATTGYDPPRGTVSSWGDSYGNRVDRFLAGIAYLDGKRPSLVMARGYYTRAYVAAWNWRDGQLSKVWTFDTGHTGTSNPNSPYRGQGSHALTIGDVDGDGRASYPTETLLRYNRAGRKLMPEAPAVQIELGVVETLLGNLQFTFVMSPEGDAHIQVYATDPSSAGKGGVMLMLDAGGYERLKAIVRDADKVIDRMIAEGKVKRMVLPY